MYGAEGRRSERHSGATSSWFRWLYWGWEFQVKTEIAFGNLIVSNDRFMEQNDVFTEVDLLVMQTICTFAPLLKNN